ncbi:MAG TPA: nitroreductase family deazaflavin-dependent oxidoreductase [Pseudonocardiaceae bacterium]|jgi:deazaflavin-dependent oxidoreductase (nitroreductase family)|nr:nitroreductase family deazaflavin-dependent oxidoreductase [Pseudonocardiaceae bacterium]
MSQPQDSPVGWVNDHIRKYVDSGGAEGHDWRGVPTLLLTTTGRKSGKQHRTALIYSQVGDDYVLVASRGGAPTHPAWFLNLEANPDVRLQVRDEEFGGRARVAAGDERERLWQIMAQVWPDYDKYKTKTEREIPVIVVERA